MSTNLQVFTAFSTRLNGQDKKGGSTANPFNYALTGEVYEFIDAIANGANSVMYSNTLGSFDFLWLQSDYNTRVVITDTNSNTFSLHIRGTAVNNQYGIPLILAFDETDGGTAVINAIQVFNTSGNTAHTRLVIIK